MDSGRVGVTQVWSRKIGPQGCLLGGHQEAFLGALQCSGNIKVSGVGYSWQIVAKNTITQVCCSLLPPKVQGQIIFHQPFLSLMNLKTIGIATNNLVLYL